jgi:hypothetical protein
MRPLFVLAIVGSLGCKYLDEKPPASQRPKYVQDRLDTIEDINSQIDLAIAKHDQQEIQSAQLMVDVAQRAYNADDLSSAKAGKDFEHLTNTEDELAKVLDAAARHRHH